MNHKILQFLLPLVANFVLRISSKTHFRYQQTSFYAEHASIVLWDVLPCLKSVVCVFACLFSLQLNPTWQTACWRWWHARHGGCSEIGWFPSKTFTPLITSCPPSSVETGAPTLSTIWQVPDSSILTDRHLRTSQVYTYKQLLSTQTVSGA